MGWTPDSLRYPLGLGLLGKLERSVRVFGESLGKARLRIRDSEEEDGRGEGWGRRRSA